eukprot:24139-Eustigmatos_ZCMA.PRE.1
MGSVARFPQHRNGAALSGTAPLPLRRNTLSSSRACPRVQGRITLDPDVRPAARSACARATSSSP